MACYLTRLSEAEELRDPRYGAVWELAGTATDLPALGLAMAEVDPGALSPPHFHRHMSEAYFILEGEGEMWMDGVRFPVGPGDAISIAPGVVHALGNAGPDPLRFVVTTAGAYDPDDDIEV